MVEQYSLIGDDQLHEYTDLEELGSSSLSVVYAATELAIRRRVVLRVLLVDKASPVIAEVLDREVVALGALWAHPNIVSLLRLTASNDGRPVLVFERCKGSVASNLKDEPFSPEDVTSLGIKIAGALECAHRQGILHRDIKPERIFLTEFGEPALADFGMARLEAASQFTVGGVEVRTSHTPPEVLEGRPPTAVSDVYGLASTMYQLLAGRSPFRSDDLESTAAVMMRILRDDPPPLPSSVPPDLADAIYRALSKDPAQRPSGALALGGVLSGIEEANGWGLTCPVGVEAQLPHRAVQAVRPEVVEEPEPVTETQNWPPPSSQLVTDPESLIWARPEARPESVAAPGLCPNGHQMPAGARFCGVCGAPMLTECEEGHQMPGDATFCPVCGRRSATAAV